MGARASALGNAVGESFFGSLKSAIFEWVEAWYNRRHSMLG